MSTRLARENGDTAASHVHVRYGSAVTKIFRMSSSSVSSGVITSPPTSPPPTVSPGVAYGCGKTQSVVIII